MADAPTDPAQQAADDARKSQAVAQRWIAELGVSEKAQQKYITRAKKIIRRYKKEGSTDSTARQYAMLWSNTETIRPAVYSQPPQAIVSRRFKDSDPVAKLASETLERGLTYSIDVQDMDAVLSQATFDFVLIARGQAWERYVPTHGPQVIPEIPVLQVTTDAGVEYRDDDGNTYDADDVTEEEGKFTAKGEPFEPVVFEESLTDYVNWEDFGTSVCRTWNENDYVWRRVFMGREALIQRFGEEIGKRVPLDWGAKVSGNKSADETDMTKKAAIYEIWDKPTKCVYWISKAYSNGPLDQREDPLGLDNFFPCPRPLYGTLANDSLIPVPDYVFWQDQAEEIDELTARIAVLQDALKVKGFYAADEKTNLNNLMKSDTNILIPVPAWQKVKDEGGIRGMIEWMPIEQVVAGLKACIDLRAQLKSDVDEITGISDIIRGASDPRETATAAGLKGHWGPLRIRSKQKELARFARDILRIKGEVISEKFGIDTLKAMTGLNLPTAAEKQQLQAQLEQAKMVLQGKAQAAQQAYQAQVQQAQATGQQPPPPPAPPQIPPIPDEVQEMLSSPTWEDVKGLLSDNASRQFRVDIETDSTIEPNETEEKALATEFATALSSFIAQWGPQVAAQPALAPLAAELLKFVVRRYRAGRELEDVIESTMSKIMAQPPPQQGAPAQPAPDKTPVEVATVEQQTEQIKQQGETQRAMIGAQAKAQEIPLKQGDQQLEAIALSRDPTPQVIQ